MKSGVTAEEAAHNLGEGVRRSGVSIADMSDAAERDRAAAAEARQHHERTARSTVRVLVTGIPRSGTSWVGLALSTTPETVFIDEPDCERRFKVSADAKRGLGRYPVIAPGDTLTVGGYSIVPYREMWEEAWNVGNQFSPKNVVLKTNLSTFCMEWLQENFPIDHVIWVDRYPLNTLGSWVEYARKAHSDESMRRAIKRMCWQYGMLYETYCRLDRTGYIDQHVQHENLAGDFTLFKQVAERAGLQWTYRTAEYLNDMNQAGEGGHWGLDDYKREDHVHRNAADENRWKWRHRMGDEEVDMILGEMEAWPLARQRILEGFAP